MSSYDSSRSRRRGGAWSYIGPLLLTFTVATVGVAAWAWHQHRHDDSDAEDDELDSDEYQDDTGLDYENGDYGDNPPYGASEQRTNYHPPPPGESTFSQPDNVSYGLTAAHAEANANAGWGTSMSGALRRTPSPQQFLSTASKTVAAGVGAVGAAMGSALAAIREEDKNAYADHETWSEEAEARKPKQDAADAAAAAAAAKDGGSRRRRTVAIVVSADAGLDDAEGSGYHEHASILSHIPRNTDFAKTKLFVLIYSPGLKDTVLENAQTSAAGNPRPPSLSSSFSAIEANQAHTPGSEIKSPILKESNDIVFNAIYMQATSLVEKESMVMPFSTPNGHVHILRHLAPEVVYLQDSLSGHDGGYVTQLQTWLRHDLILIVGADGGHGGLADSESEGEDKKEKEGQKGEKWWQRPDRVGRGRGVVVVDGLRVGDDWARRVEGKE